MRHLIGVLVVLGLNSPALAVELAPPAGRGATLTVFGLVTLVLAAAVFALFHWLEARKEEPSTGSTNEVVAADVGQDASEGVATPKLAILPENPMLSALSLKQSGANTALTEPSDGAHLPNLAPAGE